MITLIDGDLYQWDTGRVVLVEPDSGYSIHEVHFTTKKMEFAYVVKTYDKDQATYAAIPNILLQQYQDIICYEVRENDAGEESVSTTTFDVIKRNRPVDYVYTEPEKYTYKEIEERLANLETEFENVKTASDEAAALANEAYGIAETAQNAVGSILETLDQKSAVQVNGEFLSTLNIYKLTQEEYDKAVEEGTVDGTAVYLTPDNTDEVYSLATEAKSVADNANAAVEALSSVVVKSINNTPPDENGNVTIEAGTGSSGGSDSVVEF